MKTKPLFTGSDWNDALLYKMWGAADSIGQKYGLDYYRPQIEVISAEQMLDNYSTHGLAATYNHWSFGKTFSRDYSLYKGGRKGLAFEIVINSSPSICYVMDTNTALMQQLVIAHAAVGHSSFFKSNYLFKDKTDAKYILDFLVESRKYIKECEYIYGLDKVETLLDAAHSIQMNSVSFSYNKLKTKKQREDQLLNRIEAERENAHPVFDKLLTRPELSKKAESSTIVTSNLLLFFETYSDILAPWERKILSIVRYLGEYFYPQMLTKVSNEGWASFWHYTILQEMFDKGQLTDGHMLEFIDSHSGVLYQPDLFKDVINHQEENGTETREGVVNEYYSGINPYALGFAIYTDIRRLSENPTEEDKRLFPDMAGGDWVANVKYAMENFRDDGFLDQFLSPSVAKRLKLFSIKNILSKSGLGMTVEKYNVTGTTESEESLHFMKQALLRDHNYSSMIPEVTVVYEKDRMLQLHFPQKGNKIVEEDSRAKVVSLIANRLWGKGISLIHNII